MSVNDFDIKQDALLTEYFSSIQKKDKAEHCEKANQRLCEFRERLAQSGSKSITSSIHASRWHEFAGIAAALVITIWGYFSAGESPGLTTIVEKGVEYAFENINAEEIETGFRALQQGFIQHNQQK